VVVVVVVVTVAAAAAAASQVTGMLSTVFTRSYTGLWNHPLSKKLNSVPQMVKCGSACSVKILILMLVYPIAPLSGDIPLTFLAATHHFNSVLLSSCHRYDIHLQSL
jgi:hypothetical protein